MTMLTYAQVIRRSMKYAGIFLAGDLAVALLPFFTWIDSSRIGIIGDLLLAEVAALFIMGGIVDVSSSAGMTGFRKLFSSNIEYSAAKRKESESRALVFLIAGSLLLAAMIALATYDLWIRAL